MLDATHINRQLTAPQYFDWLPVPVVFLHVHVCGTALVVCGCREPGGTAGAQVCGRTEVRATVSDHHRIVAVQFVSIPGIYNTVQYGTVQHVTAAQKAHCGRKGAGAAMVVPSKCSRHDVLPSVLPVCPTHGLPAACPPAPAFGAHCCC